MTALELIEKNYLGTDIESKDIVGIKEYGIARNLDCNCVDCGDDSDCSTSW